MTRRNERSGIKELTRPELDEILNSPGEKYEPLGLYVCPDEVGCTIWTAVDNSTGDAWTEEFGSRMMAVRWLHGYKARNIYGEVLN